MPLLKPLPVFAAACLTMLVGVSATEATAAPSLREDWARNADGSGEPEIESDSFRSAHPIGLGLQFGEPVALTAKAFLHRRQALELGFAFWSPRGRCAFEAAVRGRHCTGTNVSVQGNYLLQRPLVRSAVTLDWHSGLGTRLRLFSQNEGARDVELGLRLPLGLDWFLQPSIPVELFFETAPVIFVFPSAYLAIEGAIGARYHF